MMRHCLVLFGVLVMFGSVTTVEAQNVLSLSDGEGEPGDSVTITVSLEAEDPVEAFEFDVCSTGFVDIGFGDLDLGADTVDLDFDTQIVSFDDDGWSIAAVLDSDSTIDAGEDIELFLATYELVDEGTEVLSFCGDFLEPVLTLDGEEVTPDTVSGTIDIELPPAVYALSISNAGVEVDEEITITVSYSTDGEDLTAYEFDVCNDDLVSIGLGDVELGIDIEDLDFTSHVITFEDEGWSVAVVMDADVIEAGIDYDLYQATYTGLENGASELTFCGDLIAAIVTAGGEEIGPTTDSGIIDVGFTLSEYSFILEDKTVQFDDEGAGSFTADISVSENPDNDLYPQETRGIQMGIANDPTYVLPTSVEAAGVLAAIDGGDGPGYMGINIIESEDGVTFGAVYDLFGVATIEYEEESVVATLSYDLNEDELEGEEETIETELEFVNNLGLPTIACAVVVTDAAGIAITISAIAFKHGQITLQSEEIEDEPKFLRGDCSGNGSVSALSDAGFLLNWAFNDGDDPPCMDAADADDSGSVATLVDAVFLLRWAFASGDDPPDPGTNKCGVDPDGDADDVLCETPLEDCD